MVFFALATDVLVSAHFVTGVAVLHVLAGRLVDLQGLGEVAHDALHIITQKVTC